MPSPKTNWKDQVRSPLPQGDPDHVRPEDHLGGHLRRRRVSLPPGPDGPGTRGHRPRAALQDLRPEGRRLPRPLRPHRAREARHPRRVHAADPETPPGHLPRLRPAPPLSRRDPEGLDHGRGRARRRRPDREGHQEGAGLPPLRRTPAQGELREADHLLGGPARGRQEDRAQADAGRHPGAARADPRLGPASARDQPRRGPARVDHPDRAARAAGHDAPLDHPRERPAVRGRSHAQARGHHPDQPAVQGEPGRGRAPADHRGPLGAPPVPRHDLPGQRGRRLSPGPTPLGTAAQDPLAAAQGQGRPVPRLALRESA